MSCPRLRKLSLTRCALVAFTVGSAIFLAVAVFLFTKGPDIVQYVMYNNLIVVPGTGMFPNWVDYPVPIVTSIYLFNVTNSEAVAKHAAKPRLEQLGPYVYHEYHHKTKLVFTESNGTVTYQQIRTYAHQPHLSNGSLSDKIVTLNAVAASANAIALGKGKEARWTMGAALFVMQEKLFTETTVQKLLFDGYEDPVLKAIPKWLVPGTPDRFGYYYQRNGSDWFDGVFNMYTGQSGLEKMCHMHSWNYSTHLGFYEDHCGDVNGEGDFFSPGQTKTHVNLFSNDLCRSIKIAFDKTAFSHGIKVYTYKIDKKLFANATEEPDNWCYDPAKLELPSGVFGLGPCRQEAPVFMSQPHFYQADPYYVRELEPGSLDPNQGKHETVFNVEPSSGLPVDVTARFQVNFYIKKIGNMEIFQHMRDQIMFPTVWFESKVELPFYMLAEIWMLSNLLAILTVSGCILLLVALAMGSMVGLHYYNQSVTGVNRVGSAEDDDAGRESLVTEEEPETTTTTNEQSENQEDGRQQQQQEVQA